eukprot:TRINITY_DN4192_c0_g1_i1.p1 TRINITY_DN4192_c0_g1~~TRINITY_DN4192_c0_g1_i1.p1  ORF type:complete len:153 (+),score=20.19 TRINITY_DN4192_c0_g1_i1:488-946(+)
MGRNLLLSTFQNEDQEVTVGVVHLESIPKNAPIRLEQALYIQSTVVNNEAFIVGDFNFVSPEERETILQTLPDWVDVWHSANPDDDGFTWDPVKNKFCYQKSDQNRIDMILQHSNSSYECSQCYLVGDTIIDSQNFYPSDHFGVFAKFTSTE